MSTELINQLLQMVKNGVDFTVGQLPDIARQVLEYNYFINSVTMWSFIGAGFLFLVLLLILNWVDKHTSCDMEYVKIGVFILCAASFLLCLFIIPISLTDNYKIKHYPKLYIIDYLHSQLKSNK